MKSNFGETYLDHYECYFKRPPDSRSVFHPMNLNKSIQILHYDKVFKGCKVFCSLGLSHYIHTVGKNSEIFTVVDQGFEYIPKIMAEVISFIVEKSINIGYGLSISGIRRISPEFYARFRKDALYLTRPYNLPDSFEVAEGFDDGTTGHIYNGILLFESEHKLFCELGAEKFEAYLEKNNVDPIDIGREIMQ